VPNKRVFARNFTALFYSKKSAAKAHRILVETYGDYIVSKITDIDLDASKIMTDVEDKECSSALKKFKDDELKALLHENSCQMLNLQNH